VTGEVAGRYGILRKGAEQRVGEKGGKEWSKGRQKGTR